MASLPEAVLKEHLKLAYKGVREIGSMTDDELLTAIHCAGQMSAIAEMNYDALMKARDARLGIEDEEPADDAQDAHAVQAAVAAQAALIAQARRERRRVTAAARRERKRALKLADAAGPSSEETAPVKRAKTTADGKRKIVLNVAD